MSRTYTARAFARLAGVTPKTLRHYEWRHLLTPRRNAAAYRVYSDRDLRKIREVVALKSLGLTLTQIRDLMDRRTVPLDALRAQREALESKRRSLDRAIGVIGDVERTASNGSSRAAFAALVAEAGWSHAEQVREQHPRLRPPDRASESRVALAHAILRAVQGGDEAETQRSRLRALVAREAAGDPESAAGTRKALANWKRWPCGMREYVASLYDMDVESFGKVALFLRASQRAPVPVEHP